MAHLEPKIEGRAKTKTFLCLECVFALDVDISPNFDGSYKCCCGGLAPPVLPNCAYDNHFFFMKNL